jgi:hypothetical protein
MMCLGERVDDRPLEGRGVLDRSERAGPIFDQRLYEQVQERAIDPIDIPEASAEAHR